MAEKPSLTPENLDAACLLVGKFMWHWAMLESGVNTAYCKLLQIKGLNGFIATANLSLRDKLHVVRTIVHLVCHHDDAWWRAANKDLDAISDMNGSRNLVAHNLFSGHSSGGVDFLIIKAKGKFAVPDVLWLPEEFERQFSEIIRLQERVLEIAGHVEGIRAAPEIIAREFERQQRNPFASPPTQELNALTGRPALGRPTQEPPDGLSPSRKEAGGTPLAPQPKPRGRKAP